MDAKVDIEYTSHFAQNIKKIGELLDWSNEI